MSTRCPVRRRNARSATTGSRWGWSPRARRPAPRTRSSSGRSSNFARGRISGSTSSRHRASRPSCMGPIPTGRWEGSIRFTSSWTSRRSTGSRGNRRSRRATWPRALRSRSRARQCSACWRSLACAIGAWAILLFGLFSVLSALGARAEDGRLQMPALRAVGGVVKGGVAKLVAGVGGLLGLFIAGYTGILLSVTNRPIWADSPWLGALFIVSGVSTGAAALILLSPGRGATERSLGWLSSFDAKALVVELLVLIAFIVSLGSVNRVWVSLWGLLLFVGVVGFGILAPLRMHAKPAQAAKLVLLGGFLLRLATMLASEGIDRYRMTAGL